MTRFCGYVPVEDEKFFVNPFTERKHNEKIGIPIENCAVAYAIYKVFPYATVGSKYINLTSNLVRLTATLDNYMEEGGIKVEMPFTATTFIEEFDESSPHIRKQLKPFSFEITIPQKYLDLIDISEIKEKLATSEILELVE